MNTLNSNIKQVARIHLDQIEKYFNSDVLFYFGTIHYQSENFFRTEIEALANDKYKKKIITIILNTVGGSVETSEKFVNIIRHFYDEVYFIIPDYAMSAGAIFCMSGDKIYMDYSSHLGPVDPQIYNAKLNQYVPANGYLDKVSELLEKAQKGVLSNAEYIMLQNQDLGFLEACKNAKTLAIELLKKWLVKYKFKDWNEHSSTKETVTESEKENRAREIAESLASSKWFSHSRPIYLHDLQKIKLVIDDYTENANLTFIIRQYNDFILDYIYQYKYPAFIHSRLF